MTKLNLVSLTAILFMTSLVLLVGIPIIDNILYGFNGQILRLHLSTVVQVLQQELNSSGVRAATQRAATLQSELRKNAEMKTARIYIIEEIGSRVVYHPDFHEGDVITFDYVKEMFRREDGFIEYAVNGTSEYAVFTMIRPLGWLIGLSVSKSEMLARKFYFLWAIGGITFIVLFLNALVVSRFGHRLQRRIGTALDCVNRIKQGELSARIPTITILDEVGRLQEGINAMGASIQQKTLAQQEVEQALRNSTARFRRMFESNMIGIIFASLSGGNIIDANDYFLGMVGYTRDDLEAGAVRWTDLTPPELAYLDERAIAETRARGVCRSYEKEYIHKNGSRVPALVGGAMLEGSQDEVVAFIVDISEKKQTEKERDLSLVRERKARAEAENALRTRDEFMAIAAHELRTPLTPLKMQLQLLKRILVKRADLIPRSKPNLFGLIETSDQQVDRLSKLVESLLDVSRINTGRLRLNLEETSLSGLVSDVAERYQSELKRANCALELKIEKEVRGQWDRLRIEQVIVNLLTNAIKYGAGKPIHITVSTDQEQAKLRVKDYGIGIEKKDQERIFERFERAVSIQYFGGFGLGLYISRQIVQAHGGRIYVESQLGVGSEFIVELPFSYPVVE